jgi:hypothetical protein
MRRGCDNSRSGGVTFRSCHTPNVESVAETWRVPLGPLVHGEDGESSGSLIRPPTVVLLPPLGERHGGPAGRALARSHARVQLTKGHFHASPNLAS